MTTLNPRPPYTPEEIQRLYPPGLRLKTVMVFFRHGERTPEHARFRNTGLPTLWPYCSSAGRMINAVMSGDDPRSWTALEWRRRVERIDDTPVRGSHSAWRHEGDNVDPTCAMAELTDKGRQSMLDLGSRLRHLYVHQLGFLPETISRSNTIYLRSSPFPRALHSLQQAFTGLYPPNKRDKALPPPTIVTRTLTEETLLPNEDYCQRFIQLIRAYSQRTAQTWNHTSEMDYLNRLIQKWMPSKQRVAVDSNPRLHGIWDTINATLATPAASNTRLPVEFYDPKARKIIDSIAVEEEFSGYKESREYRMLGIGALLGEVVQRMVSQVQEPEQSIGGSSSEDDAGSKFTLAACHDSTLAAIVASLGTMEGELNTWPSYASCLAVELFESSSLEGFSRSTSNVFGTEKRQTRAERVSSKLPSNLLPGYYVRIRYNDRPITIPGCKTEGHHLHGEESFCTLAAFKDIVDKFTPADWKQACVSNLDKNPFPVRKEPPGS